MTSRCFMTWSCTSRVRKRCIHIQSNLFKKTPCVLAKIIVKEWIEKDWNANWAKTINCHLWARWKLRPNEPVRMWGIWFLTCFSIQRFKVDSAQSKNMYCWKRIFCARGKNLRNSSSKSNTRKPQKWSTTPSTGQRMSLTLSQWVKKTCSPNKLDLYEACT